VGKGTQGQRLSADLGNPTISSGEMFRQKVREDSPLARKIRSYMDRGVYVPDELTIDMVLERLREPDAQRGFILDGFPRTEVQAAALDKHLATEGRKVDLALHITAPIDVLARRVSGRLTCPVDGASYNLVTNPPKVDNRCDQHPDAILQRRSDEDIETFRTRVRTYEEQTRPLIEYYRRHGTLLEIDGSLPIDRVEAEIDDALAGRAGVA
jgi:adenylate kinase